jgi:hypothetical protein
VRVRRLQWPLWSLTRVTCPWSYYCWEKDRQAKSPGARSTFRRYGGARERTAAIGRKVTTPKETEGEEGEEVDRGVGAQTELPSGVPMWPPRVLLARERIYTKSWDKWILKQGESNRSESGPHAADGDMVSDVMLWLDYSLLADKMALAAEDEGDMDTAWALSKIGMAYRYAAYQADCKSVDHDTLD